MGGACTLPGTTRCPVARRLLLLSLLLALLEGPHLSCAQERMASQAKTRNLKGPANQPWKCKPVKIRGAWHGHYLHDKTFINWECENTEVVQKVYEMTVITRPSSEVYDNINNVFGLAKSMSTTGTVAFLGKFNKLDECELACFRFSSGGAKCTGYTWHRVDFADHRWARQCFAVLDGRWSPVQQFGAVSGKVVRDSNAMQDASGRGCIGSCSGHGVCQNTTGVCICDIGFQGFDCGLELACDSPAVEGRCYTVFERKSSWQKAAERCARGGGALATISSHAQQTVLASVLAGCASAWIGLSDHEEEGAWEWADGTRSAFRNWAVGEPNNKGNEDFVLMRSSDGKWADSNGKSGSAACYACSYRDGATSANQHQPLACARDCSGHGSCGAVTGTCSCVEGYFGVDCSKRSPCEGKVIGDKCYVVYGETGNRDVAEAKCRNRGGHLSGVVSQEHEAMLLQLAEAKGCRGQEMWISLNDQEREGVWEWADRDMGENDYVNWQPWEPNNGAVVLGGSTRRQEDGVVMDKYGWADAEVTRGNVSCFACEFVGGGVQESASTLSRLGEALPDLPVLFNFFAPDAEPVLRRVSCAPGSGVCIDEEGYGGMEPIICGEAPVPGGEDAKDVVEEEEAGDGGEWEEVPEGEEGEEEEEEVGGEEAMPAAATLLVPTGMCRAGLSLMNSTAERCWRSCALAQFLKSTRYTDFTY